MPTGCDPPSQTHKHAPLAIQTRPNHINPHQTKPTLNQTKPTTHRDEDVGDEEVGLLRRRHPQQEHHHFGVGEDGRQLGER